MVLLISSMYLQTSGSRDTWLFSIAVPITPACDSPI